MTLHRPANVDNPAALAELLGALTELSTERQIIFPVHPRTRVRLCALNWQPPSDRFILLEPVPYVEMLGLILDSDMVITDSGGLQEETTFLGIPCLTVRESTERPITCTEGTNRLMAAHRNAIRAAAHDAANTRRPDPPAIERWDGKAAERIAAILCNGAN